MADGYLRPIVYVGDGAMGVYAPNNPIRTAIIAWKWGAYLGEEALKSGIRAKISSFARHHINVSLAKGKIMGQYTSRLSSNVLAYILLIIMSASVIAMFLL